MTPEEALRLQGTMLRQAAHRARHAAIGHHFGMMGGWFGEPQEHVRFLMFFDYTREKGLMSEERFTQFWPHHGMVLDPCWPEVPQWWN